MEINSKGHLHQPEGHPPHRKAKAKAKAKSLTLGTGTKILKDGRSESTKPTRSKKTQACHGTISGGTQATQAFGPRMHFANSVTSTVKKDTEAQSNTSISYGTCSIKGGLPLNFRSNDTLPLSSSGYGEKHWFFNSKSPTWFFNLVFQHGFSTCSLTCKKFIKH